MGPIKALFTIVIPVILLLFSYAAYNYSKEKDLFKQIASPKMTYELYHLNKTESWKDRFDFLESKDYNSVKRTIIGNRENFLEVRRGFETYLIEYDSQVDTQLITQVRQVREASDKFDYKGRYFLVQYDKFVEIVYFNTSLSSTPLSKDVENGTYQAPICLELPIGASSNARYHIDEDSNIWIVTASMNKVVFIQIYSCSQGRLIKQFRHILRDQQYVNEIVRIIKKDKDCLVVETVTYNLNIVELEMCPHTSKIIKENEPRRSHEIAYEEVEKEHYSIFQGYTSNTYSEQLQKIVKYIINFITFSPNSTLLYDRKPSLDQNKKEQFDVIGVDSRNNYLINFSKKSKFTGIMSLGRYLINTKTPLFHNNPSYNKYDALNILDRQYKKEYVPEVQHKYIVPGLNETKKVTYKAAYPVFPDFKVEHLGLTSSVVVFWPQQKLEEKDYTLIRTHEGGLVSEGGKFKGSFDKLPTLYEQVYQRVDAKAQEVTPGIYELHMGYVNLMTYLIRSKESQEFIRVQLINMLGGKPVLTHYINTKEGYRYMSTTLLNNQWWVLQYSQASKKSTATKYQLYANVSNPTAILSIRRQYGVIGSQQHLNGEDDLAELMSEFVSKYNNGFVLLNVYRCIDQYYYVEYTDSLGQGFGVARIHFKNFSNRRIKKSKKYSGQFEKVLLLEERQMIPQKYSRKPYAVYLEKVSAFAHIPLFLSKSRANETWYDYCDSLSKASFKRLQKLGGFYYFPITHYGSGKYGCDFNSDSSYPEDIFVFNLRNMIINGKMQKEGKRDIRKSIVQGIFKAVASYFTVLAVVMITIAFTKKAKKEKEN